MKTIGIVLVVLGVLALIYGGINYDRHRTVLELGSLGVTTMEHRSIPVPAVVGLVVLMGGVGFLEVGKRRSLPL
jgi:hypothetical protein